jgi:uncharacterized membrane protein
MMGRVVRWPLGMAIGFLAFVGIAASATFYLREPANPGFLDFPTIVALHVVLGAFYLMFAPFQFVKRIRSRHLGYHRRMGRVLVVAGLVVGVTALFMGLVIPFSGWAESVLIVIFGGLFLFALVKGFVYVRAGQVALHREWMIRAFAIALAIATQRLIFVPAFFVVVDPTGGQIVTLSLAAWSAALVVHSSLAEVWIRLTRRRRVPKASGTGATHDPTPGSRGCRTEETRRKISTPPRGRGVGTGRIDPS